MKTDVNLSLKELQAIARDTSIDVPEGLRSDLSASIGTLAFLEEKEEIRRPRRLAYLIGAAASLALLVGIGIGTDGFRRQPKDTFSDPYLASAQLEETFSMISASMSKGMAMAGDANTSIINKTSELIDKAI